MNKFFACTMIVFAIFFANIGTSSATELYDAIYRTVNYHNKNPEHCRWITDAIIYASGQYAVDPILITSVMEAESGFNFGSTSPVGAIGLMQLMPGTAKMIGVNPHNPLENVIGGTIYLRNQLNRFANWG